MKRYTGILLDFDYTLADSSVGVYDCVNYGLEAIGGSNKMAEALK